MSEPLVLVVDDDEGVRAATAAMLDLIDCQAVVAESGERGLDLLYASRPAAVILDIDLPGMDGVETYERMEAIRADVPVVFSSGQRNIDRVRRFLDRPTVQFLEKPYTVSQLMDAFAALRVMQRS